LLFLRGQTAQSGLEAVGDKEMHRCLLFPIALLHALALFVDATSIHSVCIMLLHSCQHLTCVGSIQITVEVLAKSNPDRIQDPPRGFLESMYVGGRRFAFTKPIYNESCVGRSPQMRVKRCSQLIRTASRTANSRAPVLVNRLTEEGLKPLRVALCR